MMSTSLTLLPQLIRRRPFLPPVGIGGGSGSSCQQCRWASGGGRKQKLRKGSSAAKKKKTLGSATSSTSGGGGSKKKKKIPPTKRSSSPPPPPPRQDLPKAPHMQIKDLSSNNNNNKNEQGLVGWLQQNPIFVAIAIVPTGVMGVLLLFRPQLRPKWMGGESQVGGGSGNIGGGSSKGSSGVSMINEDIANAPALYESGKDDESLKKEGEKKVSANIDTVDQKQQQSQSADEEVKEEVVVVVEEISIKTNGNEGEVTEVVDLISAIGIKPHPSS